MLPLITKKIHITEGRGRLIGIFQSLRGSTGAAAIPDNRAPMPHHVIPEHVPYSIRDLIRNPLSNTFPPSFPDRPERAEAAKVVIEFCKIAFILSK
jgi:hypothetical protein